MTRTLRRTDLWLTLIALALLVLAPVQNALANNLPELLPPSIRDDSPRWFAALLVLMIFVDLALVLLRRALSADPRRRVLRRWNLILSVSLGVLGALAGIFSNLVVAHVPLLAQLSRSQQPWLTLFLPVLLLALLIALPILADLLPARPDRAVQNRSAFLRQLESRYRRYLDDPLQRAVRAHLDLRETPYALQQPEITFETPDHAGANPAAESSQPPRSIAPNETLLSLFEAAHGQLLILGAPGAGKSTQLYALGRELVRQAQAEATNPVVPADPIARLPVVLDLSTWASNRDPLETWLADQITESYGVRKDIAAGWVQSNQILPLLDALDVMTEDARPLCINEINAYLARHPDDSLIVCSRRNEYERIPGARLTLNHAMTIEPLSNEAILHALDDGGSKLATLRQVVASDRDFMDAVRTPLLLSLVMLTYSDLLAEAIPLPRPDATDAWRHELFRHYVERMLSHAPGSELLGLDYTEDQFRTTLAWLGYELREENENTFYVEGLVDEMLPSIGSRRHYHRLLWTVLLGSSTCVALLAGLSFSLRVGLSFGLGIGAGSGLFFGLIVALGTNTLDWIVPVARLTVTWKLLPAYLYFSPLLVGVVTLISIEIALILDPGITMPDVLEIRLDTWYAGMAFIGFIIFLTTWLFVGIEPVHVQEEDLRRPNEGMRRSAQSALLILLGVEPVYGALFGISVWVVTLVKPNGSVAISAWLIAWLGAHWGTVLSGVVFYGLGGILGTVLGSLLGAGTFIALRLGGAATLRHFALRRALLRAGIVPPHLVRFLEQASARVLLRRVGGGYQFIHQLLRDDFADQYILPKDR